MPDELAPAAVVTGRVRRMRPLLGCLVEIGVSGPDAGQTGVASIESAFAVMERVQRSLSFHDPASELTRLNQAAGRRVALSPLARRVLRLARGMTRVSGGAFNCTVGGALVSAGRLPDHGGNAALPVGHADDIVLDAAGARLDRPVRITLDGIAKGYAVDLAVSTLRCCGVGAGWVNAGGDLSVFGDLTLPVRVRDAQRPGTVLGLREAALATSSAGADPRSFPALLVDSEGRQVAAGQWSVLARRAWRADALTKIAAATPSRDRAALLLHLGGRLVDAAPESAA